MIVDSQVHVWGAHSSARPWPADAGNVAHQPEPVGVGQTLRLLDEAGVRRAVLVPPSWEGDRNDVALAAAAGHPDRFAVMGRFPLADPAEVGRLRHWRDQPGMLGVRLTLHREPWRTTFCRGELDWFWRAALEAGLPIMVYAPGLSDRLGAVARRFSGLRLVVDHLALPVGVRGAEAFAGLGDVLALARYPQVAVKASALPCHSRQGFPFADVHEPLRRVYEEFGPRRLFWGSDWTRLPCSYQDNLRLFTETLPFLFGVDLCAVLGASLLDWLDWPPREENPASPPLPTGRRAGR